MSIFAKGNLTTYAVPQAQKTNLPGKWEYQGCLSEGASSRVWKYQTNLPANNTATECLNRCAKFGFMAGGMVRELSASISLVLTTSCSQLLDRVLFYAPKFSTVLLTGMRSRNMGKNVGVVTWSTLKPKRPHQGQNRNANRSVLEILVTIAAAD